LAGAATLFDLIGTNTVPQLVEAFNDPKLLVRKTALFSVGLFVESKGVKAPDNAIPGVIKALGDPDEAIRTMSTIMIGHMAPASSNAIPSLIKALDKPGTNLLLLIETANALGKFGSAASNASPKLKVLLTNPSFGIRTEAAVVLWQIDADTTTVLPVLMEMLPRLEGVMRWRIIEALGQMGPAASNAFPLLVDELNKMTSASPVDRKKITDAMFKIDPEAAAMELR
jgi:HEAT repeat protein